MRLTRAEVRGQGSALATNSRSRPWEALPPSVDNPALGKGRPLCGAGGNNSGRGFTCRPRSPSASMQNSGQNTSNSSPQEKPQNRPSMTSCDSSSSPQTLYSKKVEDGSHGWLDHHGYARRARRSEAYVSTRFGWWWRSRKNLAEPSRQRQPR